MKTIILGADHAGFELKEVLKKFLIEKGWDINDVSPNLIEGDDYPLIAKKVAQLVTSRSAQADGTLALLVCGSGMGMDIAANRVKGARAIVARNEEEARSSRRDDFANILVLGGRITNAARAKRILQAWLKTPPSKAIRHIRRVQELDQ